MSNRLFLVRHGETDEDSPENPKFSGPGAIALNDKGRSQMKEVGTALKNLGVKPALLLSSPITRSRQSADILADIFSIEVQEFEPLRDWKNGAVAGLEIAKILPFVVFFERNPDLLIPASVDKDSGASNNDNETYSSVWQRSERGQDYLLDLPYENADIIALAHSRFIAMTKMRVIDNKGMEPTDFRGSPTPGGAVLIQPQGENGKDGLSFELVFGKWNGDTR